MAGCGCDGGVCQAAACSRGKMALTIQPSGGWGATLESNRQLQRVDFGRAPHSDFGAIWCKVPRDCWQRWETRHFRVCNLQNLNGLTEFDSHPLRHLHSLPLARWWFGWSSGIARRTACVVTWHESHHSLSLGCVVDGVFRHAATRLRLIAIGHESHPLSANL